MKYIISFLVSYFKMKSWINDGIDPRHDGITIIMVSMTELEQVSIEILLIIIEYTLHAAANGIFYYDIQISWPNSGSPPIRLPDS